MLHGLSNVLGGIVVFGVIAAALIGIGEWLHYHLYR